MPTKARFHALDIDRARFAVTLKRIGLLENTPQPGASLFR